MKLTQRASRLEFSVTLALDARAKEMAARGLDIVSMAVGQPDFAAPAVVQKAAVDKVESGDVRYTPAAGTLSLRETIGAHLQGTRGVAYDPKQIVVCHSAKHALSGTLMVLAEEGDEVLVPLPAWVSYVEQIKIAGAKSVTIPPTPDYRPDIDALRAAITPHSRVIMINSPCNPTGYVMSRAETQALVELALKHDLWILTDEIYRRLVYEGEPAISPVSVDERVRDRTVIIDGASKAFAMTGYRIGYAAAPSEMASALARLHSQMTGSPNAISQSAFEAALREEPPEVEKMRQVFDQRRLLLLEGLRELGLSMPEPRGAFYAFPDVSAFLDERGSVGFCDDLLETENLVLVPGSAFGADRHVRLSYALGEDMIREALKRLGRFLDAKRG